jgi:hypothetical protein
VRFDLQPDEFPGIDYRQVGVFFGDVVRNGLRNFIKKESASFGKVM